MLALFNDEMYAGSGNKTTETSVSFTSCVFDLTNAKSGATLFNAKDGTTQNTDKTAVNSVVHVTVDSSRFISNKFISEGLFFTKNTSNGSTVQFTSDSVPSTLTLESGMADPTITLPLSGGGTCSFVKDKDVDGKCVYRLINTSTAIESYIPKTAVTLDSDLIFNIYFPKSSDVSELAVNGIKIEDLSSLSTSNIGGKTYYQIKSKLGASKLLTEITLTAKVKMGSTYKTLSYSFDLISYLEELTESSELEDRRIARGILGYAKAACSYFAINNQAQEKRIDRLLEK